VVSSNKLVLFIISFFLFRRRHITQYAILTTQYGSEACLRRNEKSTKMNKNMQNEPNFSKSQMFITLVLTIGYNEKSKLDTWSKRTQTKPILSAYVADKIALPVRHSPCPS
jgi:hypothetical protein